MSSIHANFQFYLPCRCIRAWSETGLESQIICPRDQLVTFNMLSRNNIEGFCKFRITSHSGLVHPRSTTTHNQQVCNAPSYFATVWKYLKKWVDPSTAEKIEVLNPNEVSDVLKQHIDNANIPTAFGGAFEFTHGSLPAPDQNILDRLSWESSHQTLPSGPLKFSQGIDGKLTAVAVGALQGAKRNDIIARIDSDEKN